MNKKYNIADIRQTFNCTREQAKDIKEMIKQIAVEGVYEFEERQAIRNEEIDMSDEWEIPF